uniref:linear amide C-N hydrolase n=1 Tax=Mycolicibacter minnesotensis TaxID=1118379 RepID=UPI0021F35D79
HPSRDMPLPGNVNAVDRFQRASYYAALLPEPTDTRQAVASVMAIMRNVSVPFGAPYAEFGVYNTEYRTVVDLTQKLYFFELSMRNVSVPFGAPYAEFGVYNTEYRTVVDLTQKLYFFELSTSPNVIWIDFDALKLTDEPLE